jgi:hypothetical protein
VLVKAGCSKAAHAFELDKRLPPGHGSYSRDAEWQRLWRELRNTTDSRRRENQIAENYGGDDGTRTRDLCRDRKAHFGITRYRPIARIALNPLLHWVWAHHAWSVACRCSLQHNLAKQSQKAALCGVICGEAFRDKRKEGSERTSSVSGYFGDAYLSLL